MFIQVSKIGTYKGYVIMSSVRKGRHNCEISANGTTLFEAAPSVGLEKIMLMAQGCIDAMIANLRTKEQTIADAPIASRSKPKSVRGVSID